MCVLNKIMTRKVEREKIVVSKCNQRGNAMTPARKLLATARKTRRYQSVHVGVVVLRKLERSELDKQRNRCKAIFWVRHV